MLISKIFRQFTYPRLKCSARSMSSTAMDDVLDYEVGDKGVITINRPKALNAITLQMIRKIYCNLKDWENEKSLVIIKGAGDKSFSSGGDVRAMAEAGPTEESKSVFREEYQLNYLIRCYKVPYIALINGITMGGGVGLSIHGRYRVATEKTIFAMPENAIGLLPDIGASFFLSRMKGKLGLYLGMTGFRLKGTDVLKVGVATHYCESSKLGELENALLNCKDKNTISAILDKYCHSPSDAFTLEEHMEKINKYFSAPSVEDIVAKLAKDGNEWAGRTLENLAKMPPTSLKITFQQLAYGAKLPLDECLKMEYRVVTRRLAESDFKEGVRALLIDKDQKPKWNPSKLEDVSEKCIQSYFAKLPDHEELKL